MKENWEIRKLGDCFDIIRNGANIKQDINADGYPITRIETTSNDVFNRDKLGYANVYEIDKYKDYILKNNDILISHINSTKYLGRAVLYEKQENETIIHGMNLLNLSGINSNILPKYIAYYFKSEDYKLQIFKITKKAVNQASFTTTALKSIDIPIPPLSVQEAIVKELDVLHRLKELQEQQLAEYDNLAQSTFYSMFGDPIENEKGWEVRTIESICSSIVRGPFGSSLKKEFFVPKSESTYKVYEQKNAIQNDATIGEYYIDSERYKTLTRFTVYPNDIIMSCSGTIGKLLVIPNNAEKGIINQALLKFTLNNSITTPFFVFLMDFLLDGLTKRGGVIQNLGSVKFVKAMSFGLPPLSLQNDFAKRIEKIEKQKELVKQGIAETQLLINYTMDKYFG